MVKYLLMTHLVSVMIDYIWYSFVINIDFYFITNWAFKWKVSINPDPPIKPLK